MRTLCLSLAVLTLCAVTARSQKRADVDISDVKARRLETNMVIDGKLKIGSSKPVKGLVLFLDFLSADKEVLATEKALITEDALKPGDEPPFHVDSRFPVGSVRFKIRAFDAGEKELRVGNPGPFIIE
jgi:hypothetical protein